MVLQETRFWESLTAVFPDEPTADDFLFTSLALVGLLVVAVPAVTLATHVSLIAAVAGAGVIYAVLLFWTNTVFEGVGSAVFILAVFNANVPILNVPGKAQLDLLLVDVVAILAFTLLVVSRYPRLLPRTNRIEKIVVTAFGFFVVWSFASAVVSHGPSRSAALVFALNQSRNLFLLLTSILIIRETCVKCGLYPILISVFGNLAFSLVEIANGGVFGLTYLGEGYGRVFSQVSIGGLVFKSGMYAGGFTSSSRVLTALLLLCLPICLCMLSYRSRSNILLSTLALLSSVLLIRISDTDAGWMALLVTLGVLLAYAVYYGVRNAERYHPDHRWIGVYAVTGVVFSSYVYLKRPVKTSTNADVASGTTNADVASGTGTASGSISDSATLISRVVDLLSFIPFISTNTLPVRLHQYVAAIELGLRYPLFGIGGANFNLLSGSLGIPPDMPIHNSILAYLAGTGFPGAVGYLVSIIALLYVSFERSISVKRDDRLLWAGITTGMLGFHAFSFWVTSHNWLEAQAVFWLLAGIVLGADEVHS